MDDSKSWWRPPRVSRMALGGGKKMGRPPTVDHLGNSFLASLASAGALYNDVQRVAAVRPPPGRRTLHVKQVRRVAELAFMGMISAWENFLEQTTLRYLAGASTNSGYAPPLRLSRCRDLDHAYQVYSGRFNFDATRDLPDWRASATVVSRAEIFFSQGHPYDRLLCQPRLFSPTVFGRSGRAWSMARRVHRLDRTASPFTELTLSG